MCNEDARLNGFHDRSGHLLTYVKNRALIDQFKDIWDIALLQKTLVGGGSLPGQRTLFMLKDKDIKTRASQSLCGVRHEFYFCSVPWRPVERVHGLYNDLWWPVDRQVSVFCIVSSTTPVDWHRRCRALGCRGSEIQTRKLESESTRQLILR